MSTPGENVSSRFTTMDRATFNCLACDVLN